MKKADVDSNLVRHLSELLNETGLTEIEYEKDGARIRVSRGGTVAAHAPAVAAAPVAQAAGTASAPQIHAGTAVKSPMVGTAYLSADPTSPPYVKVGDTVKEGQTLLIVEAMKVMNPIPAPKAGKIIKVLVANAQPVEFGEDLVVIE